MHTNCSFSILLFDMDGTLTKSRLKIEQPMVDKLRQLKKQGYCLGLVGGSDVEKIQEQMNGKAFDLFDYVFAENGLVSYKNGIEIHRQSIKKYLSEVQLKEFINFCLRYIADLDIPVKRGTFIEFRNGMINLCPVGRNCDQRERERFFEIDQQLHIRKTMVAVLEKEFAHLHLTFSIGGQISIDVFPHGWDKTYSLRFLKDFEKIYFFGDKTMPGGNDYEIFISPLTDAHTVCGPDDLMNQLDKFLQTLKNHRSFQNKETQLS